MPEWYEYANICEVCVYAPCICGNDPENCANYVKAHGVDIAPPKPPNGE